MKKFLSDFKSFALKGNVMDLAVGVIIGAAFQGVVSSLTENILSPIIGLFTKGNFDNLALTIAPLNVTLKYGAFLTAVINFIIMAFVVFLMVRAIAKLRNLNAKKEEKAAPTTQKCPYCCTDIPIEATRCPHCTSQLTKEEA